MNYFKSTSHFDLIEHTVCVTYLFLFRIIMIPLALQEAIVDLLLHSICTYVI